MIDIFDLTQRIDTAIKYIKNLDMNNLACGKYVVNDYFYYLVQEYETKAAEEGRHEGHRKYVDIQYIVKGQEKIEYTASAFLEISEVYDQEKDILFFKEPKYSGSVILKTGDYIVFYPKDAHKPGLLITERENVKKIVGKVLIDSTR